ncbi:LysR family transcriptional regulator [Pyruvatibacter mobilis]|uniref:LysR family transcriptional regulator n=1 Tax=Pyruvatibacter mobilis TaxID=1712261 RepID=UPI003BA9AB5E
MNWDLYRAFDAVHRAGTLSAAARELGLSAATVGRHVAELEQAVGAELFIKSPRGYELTQVGTTMLEEAGPGLNAMAQAVEAARQVGRSRSRLVRISAVESLADHWLPDVLADIAGDMPDVSFEIGATNRLVDPRSGETDVVLRLGAHNGPNLVGQKCGVFGYAVFAGGKSTRQVSFTGPIANTPFGHWSRSREDRSLPTIFCATISSAIECARALNARVALPAFLGRKLRLKEQALEDGANMSGEIWILRQRDARRGRDVRAIHKQLIAAAKAFDFSAGS